MDELWREISDADGHYAISDRGRVMRLLANFGTRPNKLCKPGKRPNGYLMYILSVRNKQRARSAHRLVYEAFVGPIPKGMQINHKNGDKSDNRLANLELMTPSQNRRHAFDVLGHAGPHKLLLSRETVDEILKRNALGQSQTKIGWVFGIGQATVGRIIRKPELYISPIL